MIQNIIYSIACSFMIALAEFIWVSFYYERHRLKVWPKELLIKEFLLLFGAATTLSPVLFFIFQYDTYLKIKYFHMFPFVLSVFMYFIPIIVLILVVESYCDKLFKEMNLETNNKRKS